MSRVLLVNHVEFHDFYGCEKSKRGKGVKGWCV